MYRTRVRRARSSGGGLVTSESMADRKAASVLPLPVGAQIRVCSPAEIGGHPWICAPVGSGKDAANQARTAGENDSSTS